MGLEGLKNVEKIINSLNGKMFSELNKNLRSFLSDLESGNVSENSKIYASKVMGNFKADMTVRLENGKLHYVSVKIGEGNSVHQETIEEFLNYIKSLNASEQIMRDIKDFIWAREDSRKFREKFPDKIRRIQKFFNENKRPLVERFLKTGIYSENQAEWIYYGDEKEGVWAEIERVIDFMERQNNVRAVISVGNLTFQAWNRAIKPNTKSEHKRGSIQLKWPSIKKDLSFLMKNKNLKFTN